MARGSEHDATDDERIAPTGHYTAYVWHHLGMPNAELFVTPLGRALFWGFRVSGEGLLTWAPFAPSMTQYLDYRHRAFERALEQSEPDLVVELGAGLSRRGVTWASRGTRYVEVDLAPMVRAKQRLIDARSSAALRAAIRGRLEHVARDVLSEDFGDWLAEALRGARRPAVIAEGVLTYFTPADRRRLVGTIARALAGRGVFAAELRVRGSGASAGALGALRGAIRLVTRGRGAGEEEPSHEASRALFEGAGLVDVRAVEPPPGAPLPARVWVGRGGA
ncbi:MAG: class I SAM-dependent methyltransferase [Sandaracinaceae bacterium]|nr:class I SAM-dependent methyltransferase [Sandaracinaceae bacterium]